MHNSQCWWLFSFAEHQLAGLDKSWPPISWSWHSGWSLDGLSVDAISHLIRFSTQTLFRELCFQTWHILSTKVSSSRNRWLLATYMSSMVLECISWSNPFLTFLGQFHCQIFGWFSWFWIQIACFPNYISRVNKLKKLGSHM